MATEIVRELVNGVWRTVTSRGGGGGGSQAVSVETHTLAVATLNAATTQAAGVTLVTAKGAGKIIVPMLVTVTSAAPETTGTALMTVGLGAAGSGLNLAAPIFFSYAATSDPVKESFSLYSTDADQPLVGWVTSGPIDDPSGPYTFSTYYVLADIS